ncbi:MAG: hypothetical protein P8176_04890 [Gammaproteobacteria bacterium]
MVEATGSRPTSETFLPYTVSDQQGNEQESYREILDTVLMLAETNPPNPRPPGEDPFELPVIPKPSFNLASDSESQLVLEAVMSQVFGAGASVQQQHLATLTNRITSQSSELKSIRDERIHEMLDAAKQAQKGKKLDGLTKALGVFAVVASVALTVCSLGSATPAAAALMVAGTALTVAVTVDGMTGGHLMKKIAGDNQWLAMGLSIGASLVGAGLVAAGGLMVSRAAKAGATVAANTAEGAGAATAKAGTLANRLTPLLKKYGVDMFDLQAYLNRAQGTLLVVEGGFTVGEALSSIPSVIANYKAGTARASAHELSAESTRAEAEIQALEDFIENASQALADNFTKMAANISIMRDANAAPFAHR